MTILWSIHHLCEFQAMHVDWFCQCIYKYSCRFQHTSVLTTCTYMTTSGMHRRPFEGRHLVWCGNGWCLIIQYLPYSWLERKLLDFPLEYHRSLLVYKTSPLNIISCELWLKIEVSYQFLSLLSMWCGYHRQPSVWWLRKLSKVYKPRVVAVIYRRPPVLSDHLLSAVDIDRVLSPIACH